MLSLNHYFCMTHALYDKETREDIIMRTNGLCWDVGLVAFWWKMCHHEKQREEKWACRRQCAEEGLWHDNICAQPENYSPRISVFLQLVSWLTCGFGGINVWSCIPFLARRKKIFFHHDITLWYSTILAGPQSIYIDPDILTVILLNTPINGIQIQFRKLGEHLW